MPKVDLKSRTRLRNLCVEALEDRWLPSSFGTITGIDHPLHPIAGAIGHSVIGQGIRPDSLIDIAGIPGEPGSVDYQPQPLGARAPRGWGAFSESFSVIEIIVIERPIASQEAGPPAAPRDMAQTPELTNVFGVSSQAAPEANVEGQRASPLLKILNQVGETEQPASSQQREVSDGRTIAAVSGKTRLPAALSLDGSRDAGAQPSGGNRSTSNQEHVQIDSAANNWDSAAEHESILVAAPVSIEVDASADLPLTAGLLGNICASNALALERGLQDFLDSITASEPWAGHETSSARSIGWALLGAAGGLLALELARLHWKRNHRDVLNLYASGDRRADVDLLFREPWQ
jgi:hypothetical protein